MLRSAISGTSVKQFRTLCTQLKNSVVKPTLCDARVYRRALPAGRSWRVRTMSVMQRTGSHLARVIGPDGKTQGVLFLEDVIEELVGEIRDATQATGYRRLGQDQ